MLCYKNAINTNKECSIFFKDFFGSLSFNIFLLKYNESVESVKEEQINFESEKIDLEFPLDEFHTIYVFL